MHVSSGFLLLETVPGREAHVLDLLARIPAVRQRSVIFPAAVAVKIEAPAEGFDPLATQLRALEGVLSTRVYRAKPT